ncbi:unnamed protein product [Ceratitis capitata]|uniref:(Mediterranean fruit fly) hypothetical protein n=1 Tax=Ceratitis capitata TaxID=7213 RepID=A0A811V504_CERCA|nr:unnamed protein product [Ceratitis capitata]
MHIFIESCILCETAYHLPASNYSHATPRRFRVIHSRKIFLWKRYQRDTLTTAGTTIQSALKLTLGWFLYGTIYKIPLVPTKMVLQDLTFTPEE